MESNNFIMQTFQAWCLEHGVYGTALDANRTQLRASLTADQALALDIAGYENYMGTAPDHPDHVAAINAFDALRSSLLLPVDLDSRRPENGGVEDTLDHFFMFNTAIFTDGQDMDRGFSPNPRDFYREVAVLNEPGVPYTGDMRQAFRFSRAFTRSLERCAEQMRQQLRGEEIPMTGVDLRGRPISEIVHFPEVIRGYLYFLLDLAHIQRWEDDVNPVPALLQPILPQLLRLIARQEMVSEDQWAVWQPVTSTAVAHIIANAGTLGNPETPHVDLAIQFEGGMLAELAFRLYLTEPGPAAIDAANTLRDEVEEEVLRLRSVNRRIEELNFADNDLFGSDDDLFERDDFFRSTESRELEFVDNHFGDDEFDGASADMHRSNSFNRGFDGSFRADFRRIARPRTPSPTLEEQNAHLWALASEEGIPDVVREALIDLADQSEEEDEDSHVQVLDGWFDRGNILADAPRPYHLAPERSAWDFDSDSDNDSDTEADQDTWQRHPWWQTTTTGDAAESVSSGDAPSDDEDFDDHRDRFSSSNASSDADTGRIRIIRPGGARRRVHRRID